MKGRSRHYFAPGTLVRCPARVRGRTVRAVVAWLGAAALAAVAALAWRPLP